MISTQPSPTISAGLSREQIRQETAFSLSADLLDRALVMLPADLHITLIQIADSGLIADDKALDLHVRELSYTAEQILDRINKCYPECNRGGAWQLTRASGLTLGKLINYYRQEQFWTRRDRETLVVSELLIADIYRLYRKVENLRDMLDAELDRGGREASDKHASPQPEANPYETIA